MGHFRVLTIPNAGLPASRGPSTFRGEGLWCLSLPVSILFLFSLAFPLVITLELFTRLIHSSTVRHLSNTHWLDSRHVEPIVYAWIWRFEECQTCVQSSICLYSPVRRTSKKCYWEYYYDFFAEMNPSGGHFQETDGCPAATVGHFFVIVKKKQMSIIHMMRFIKMPFIGNLL